MIFGNGKSGTQERKKRVWKYITRFIVFLKINYYFLKNEQASKRRKAKKQKGGRYRNIVFVVKGSISLLRSKPQFLIVNACRLSAFYA